MKIGYTETMFRHPRDCYNPGIRASVLSKALGVKLAEPIKKLVRRYLKVQGRSKSLLPRIGG